MDQAVANSSTFLERMKDRDPQQNALDRVISNFWDTRDVPQEPSPVKIASYPSLESLNEEPREELTETEYEYYTRKRIILVEKMALVNDVYLAHLQNYEQKDPKDRSQKYLLQFNELSNTLHRQFDVVAARLQLPFKQPLMTYRSLENLMDAIQQEDMADKNREYFQEMAKEIMVKSSIAQKVLDNRMSVIKTPEEKGKTNLQYGEYQKESRKLLDFCETMTEKREKEADYIELEQPEGVPNVRETSKEKLNEELNKIVDQPQYVRPIGEDTLPPHYSREMCRYEPPNPIQQKERKELLEKVKEMTSEGSKDSKEEKLEREDTELSWDHEGLVPLPKSQRDRLDESPKPPRAPRGPKAKESNEGTLEKISPSSKKEYTEGKYSEPFLKENGVRMIVPQKEKQDQTDDGKDRKWDFESSRDLVDRETARWIKEQNEFLGKQKETVLQENREVGDPPAFEPKRPIKILQKQRANPHTQNDRMSRYPMSIPKDQTPCPSLGVPSRGDLDWRDQGKGYPSRERRRTQWGGYGKQYGTREERKGNQTYRTDGTQNQGRRTTHESPRQGNYFPSRNTGNGQGGNGGDEDKNGKKKYRNTGITLENDSHEENDTEDSYEVEITSQQLNQITPGGGALKIRLSKKKPIQITGGVPRDKSGIMPMKPENVQNSKQTIFSSHPHKQDSEKQQKGTLTTKEGNTKNSYNLARVRATQTQSSGSQRNQGPNRTNDPPGNGGGGDSSDGTNKDKKFLDKGGGPPRKNGYQRGGGGDDDPDPSDDGDGDDSSSSTNSSVPRRGPKYVYVLQGPPGPKGQEGQPGQAGRDGRDGQDLSFQLRHNRA